MQPSEAEIGKRVEFNHQGHWTIPWKDKQGIIVELEFAMRASASRSDAASFGSNVVIDFDEPIHGSTRHLCWVGYLRLMPTTPEEEAAYQLRKDQETDRKRREEYSMKYL